MAQPPQYTVQPAPQVALDQLFVQKLNAINRYSIKQTRIFLEGVTGGALANTYLIADLDRMVQVQGHKDMVPTPVFIIKEDSNCCVRCCCPGLQTLKARVYHANPQPVVGKTTCGCYQGHHYDYDPQIGKVAAMTMERLGCCSKCLGTCVCFECCQSDMYMHYGDSAIKAGDTKKQGLPYMGRSVVPIKGGGFTPQVDLYGAKGQFGVVEGPSCLGGWLSVCTDTIFTFSTTKGKTADLATMIKPNARSCKECCIQQFTNADHYRFEAGPQYQGLSPDDKANMLGSVMHLDYLFFENDLKPVEVRGDSNSGVILCTLCEWYLYGCLCPIQICIPYGNNG